MANSIDDRSLKILDGIVSIPLTKEDKPLFRVTPAQIRKVLEEQEQAKKLIDDILNERTITNSLTGQDVLDRRGLSIKNFDIEEVRELYKSVLNKSKEVSDELDSLSQAIEDKVVAKSKNSEVTIDVTKDINARAAIRRIFGKTTSKITFDMYKHLLSLREKLRTEDVNSITDDSIDIEGK